MQPDVVKYNQGKGNTTKEKERKKMTREEILNEITKVENQRFYLNMKDRWDTRDREEERKYYNRLRELREMLKEKEEV